MRRTIIYTWPLLFIFLVSSTRSYPVNTIQWVDLFETISTFRNNWRRTGQMPHAGPSSFRIAWSFQTSKNIFPSPVLDAAGRIYFGSQDDAVYCLDAAGKQIWKFQTRGDVDSTPTLGSDGTVYVGSDDDYLYALSPDGKLKWRFNSGNDIRSSPLVLPSNIVVFTNFSGQVYAVQNGQQLWKVDLYGGWSNASPALDESRKVMYVTSSGGTVAAISTSGVMLWQTNLYVRIQSGTTPLDRDGNIYVSTYNGLFSFSPQAKRRFMLPQIQSAMMPSFNHDNELVIVDRNGTFWRVSANGDILAQRKVAQGESFSSLLVDSSNIMYFGSRDDNFYALRPDGTVLFNHNLGKDVDSSPVLSPRGTLYFGADTGQMYAIETR